MLSLRLSFASLTAILNFMENEIIIADAKPEDAVGIRMVQKETWLCTYPNPDIGITRNDVEAKIDDMQKAGAQELAQRIKENPNYHAFVSKDKDKVVGFVSVSKQEKENEIKALYVLSNYQGRGIGGKLMNKGLEWLGKNKDISLTVVTYNTKAINFYKKFGFVEDGEVKEDIALLPSGTRMPEIRMVLNS